MILGESDLDEAIKFFPFLFSTVINLRQTFGIIQEYPMHPTVLGSGLGLG